MLAVHVPFPSCSSACLLQRQGRAGCRWPAQDGARPVAPNPTCALRRRLAAPHLWAPTSYCGRSLRQSRAIVPGERAAALAPTQSFSGGSSRWAVDCRRCRAWLEALPHLVELASHLTMRLAVDAGGSLTRGRLHQAEDLPVSLVHPVAQVPDAIPTLNLKVGRMIVCTSMNRAIRASLSRLSTSPISPLSPTLPG
jgi:hypothetical protein